MNKAELVEALAQHYDGSKAEATRALNAVVQTITRSTVAGDKVAITGFGVFEKVDRPARMVRNPRTGERKEAPATSVPRFRAGTELKAYVAGQRELPALTVDAPTPAARPARTTARTTAPAAAPAAEAPAAVQEPLVTAADAPEASATKKAGKAAAAKTSDAKDTVTKSDAKKSDAKKSDAKKSDKKADAKKAAKKSDAKKSGKGGGKKK
ncbi:HU family DNA-binding protein [Microlunatus capsulatus]|uniref:DNA-binding protein HU-beta n=1 Tax=Microlunatus capsulatus TaxID=99117 RepID=A0ABS4ZCQ1_9ACTN|nr:HU family DNA-binding protein [Microlunatus capsulatus]MBP2418817.1 DNA-binding protein HU-beta [Microlunatus capsulatus]